MRRLLLAGAAAAVISASAHAQVPVIDMTAIQNLITQINWLKQQYTELQSVYGSLAHPTNILGMATGLLQPSAQNPFPGTDQLQGIVNGTNGGSLNGLIAQIQQQNQAYRPDGEDWTAQWINQSAASTSGVQALAMNMVNSLQGRVAGLNQLEQQLNGAPDVQEVNAINGRLQAEQNFVGQQQTEASLLQTLAQTQNEAQQQQVIQEQRKDDDQLFNDTAPLP